MQMGPQNSRKGYSYWIEALNKEETIENLMGLANCYDEGNQIPINKREALYLYRKISLIDPNNIDVWVKLAEFYEQGYGINDQPHPEAAESCYQQALRISQNRSVLSGQSSPEKYAQLGTTYLCASSLIKNGKNSFEAIEARIFFCLALDLETSETCKHFIVKALVNLAYCYQMGIGGKQDDDIAIKTYEEALSLDPYCVQALNNSAYYYLQKYKNIITTNKEILLGNDNVANKFKDLKEKKLAEEAKKKILDELNTLKTVIRERVNSAVTVSNKLIILCPALQRFVGQICKEGLITPKNDDLANSYFQKARVIQNSVRPAPFDKTGMLAIYVHTPNFPGVSQALLKESPQIYELQSLPQPKSLWLENQSNSPKLSSNPLVQQLSKQSTEISKRLGELRFLQAENAKLKSKLNGSQPLSDLERQLTSLRAEVEKKQKEAADLETENSRLKRVLEQVCAGNESTLKSSENEVSTKRRARKK